LVRSWPNLGPALLGLLFALPGLLQAQPGATEAEIKAAFLLKFPSYVEWADTAFAAADSPLVIGVVDADLIAANLEQLVPGLSIDGHPMQVWRIQADAMPDGLHMLFVGRARTADAAALLQQAAASAVLTITETDTTQPAGSIINFVVVDNRVRFAVSLATAELAMVRLSSRLLQVAHTVLEGA
jgi:hypothetical protein